MCPIRAILTIIVVETKTTTMYGEDNPAKPPVLFWIISVIALLWNLMGCFQWFVEYNFWKNPASRDVLPEAMRGLYDQTPAWTYVVFALAVITGVLGCIGLLMESHGHQLYS